MGYSYSLTNGVVVKTLREEDVLHRFWSKVDWNLNDIDRCWPWTAGKMWRGYGQFHLTTEPKTVVVRSHRLAFELFFEEPIPAGVQIDHVCHTSVCELGENCPHRLCCNPHHMQLSTNKENHGPGRKIHANQFGRTS